MSVLRTFRFIFAGLLMSVMLLPLTAQAQKVAFTARFAPPDARAGEGAQIVVAAKIPAGYHMYSLTQNTMGGVPLKIDLTATALAANGKTVGGAFEKVPEPLLKVTLEEYSNSALFAIPVAVKPGTKGTQKALVKIKYQICNKNQCMLPATVEVPVTFSVGAGAPRPARKKPVTKLPTAMLLQPPRVVSAYPATLLLAGAPPDAPPASAARAADNNRERPQPQGLLPFLLVAIAAGFTSLLTPCVFPMIPITVSFFTKRKDSGGVSGVTGALVYCLGIIGTFTGLGLLMTLLFGATGIQNFAANPWVNLGLGILFVVLAANLMGAFEILLPSWLLNSTQSGQKRGGLIAPLLMGLTFSLTSFTCTSPFVGTVLLDAAHGHYFYPFVGMLAFSTAFALPFFLLALFPQAMSTLPKSGAWLVTVKAFMGFLELAAALKFLSSADLQWRLGLLTKPVFLAIWAGIAAVAGCYLLGWLRLPHDDKVKVGIARRVLGLLTLAGCVLCLSAIEGRSLGDLDAFVPPVPYPYKTALVTNQPSSSGNAEASGGGVTMEIGTSKKPLKNYEEAVKAATQQNKPIFIDFTGHVCVNCRLMEASTLIAPEVLAELKNYVVVELNTDANNAEENANQQLEQKMANTTALPVYLAVSPDGKTVQAKFDHFTRDTAEFVAFLKKGRGTQ